MLHLSVRTSSISRALMSRCVSGLLLLVVASGAAAQIVYTYDNITAGAVSNAMTPCATPLARNFVVTDAFTVGDIALGVDVDHPNRGDLRMTLVSPTGATFQFVTESADADDNYKVMFSINGEGVLDDGDTDPVANSRYRGLVTVAGVNFYAGTSAGTWTLQMCDTVGANNGTFNSARLVLRHTAGTVVSACGSNLTFDWGSLPKLTPFVSSTTGGVTLTQTATSGESPVVDVAQIYQQFGNSLPEGEAIRLYLQQVAAPIQWSTADQTVLTNAQVLGLSGGVSDLVVQWGCWNSYFVSPNANTMAHAFLLSPNKGAAGVIGVTSLTGAEAHAALGNALYPFLAPGTRVGDALRSAKTALAGQSGLHRDILLSSTLLGDPAMPIR